MQTNPNTLREQAQEKDKGRHVQTWDFGMMDDFIKKTQKKTNNKTNVIYSYKHFKDI